MVRILISYLIAINALTFVVMLWDKLQASYHSPRIREQTFYLLSLIGGSPATLLTMYTIRHKSRKLSFQLLVWLLFLLQLVLMVFMFQKEIPPLL